MPLPVTSLSLQVRDGSPSHSNCTASTLFSVLTPPAIVRHLAVFALTSINWRPAISGPLVGCGGALESTEVSVGPFRLFVSSWFLLSLLWRLALPFRATSDSRVEAPF